MDTVLEVEGSPEVGDWLNIASNEHDKPEDWNLTDVKGGNQVEGYSP